MKHTLSVLVKNHYGVLSHVSGLFTRRGYNIDSLSVGETDNPEESIITLVVDEEPHMVLQIEKQLYKLVDVISIEDLTKKESLQRELVILTVKTSKDKRHEILGLVDVFKATIVDMTDSAIMIEMSSNPRRIDTFIRVFSEYTILKMARTGTIALEFPSSKLENTKK
ncbi:MAG: acetolactate synthase small subunit [Spirochaetia bacterium]|nr:acetolactate synthase small subunit [Spirochaetia bacterium]